MMNKHEIEMAYRRANAGDSITALIASVALGDESEHTLSSLVSAGCEPDRDDPVGWAVEALEELEGEREWRAVESMALSVGTWTHDEDLQWTADATVRIDGKDYSGEVWCIAGWLRPGASQDHDGSGLGLWGSAQPGLWSVCSGDGHDAPGRELARDVARKTGFDEDSILAKVRELLRDEPGPQEPDDEDGAIIARVELGHARRMAGLRGDNPADWVAFDWLGARWLGIGSGDDTRAIREPSEHEIREAGADPAEVRTALEALDET